MEESQGQFPASPFLTGADCCIVAGSVSCNLGLGHGVEEVQGPLPLLGLLASTDGGVVAEDVESELVS